MLPINCNDSSSVWTLRVNPFTRSVYVRWFKTPLTEYRYETRRRDMLPLFLGKISKGLMVNPSLTVRGNVCKGWWVNYCCWAA